MRKNTNPTVVILPLCKGRSSTGLGFSGVVMSTKINAPSDVPTTAEFDDGMHFITVACKSI